MYPEYDVDPESGCRLPLPRREQLDDAGQRTYDSLADPKGGTIRGLRGPGGIMLHSPELSRRARPLNRYLRHEAGLGGRVRELAILTTARELDSQFEWAAHEPEAVAEGVSQEIIDIIKHHRTRAAWMRSTLTLRWRKRLIRSPRPRSMVAAHSSGLVLSPALPRGQTPSQPA